MPSISILSRIKNERLYGQISRLESNREKLRELKAMSNRERSLLTNPNFQYRRYLILKALLEDLPEDEISSFTALDATVCRDGYKSTWGEKNLDIYIDSLKQKIQS
jgi:hypothetical protein